MENLEYSEPEIVLCLGTATQNLQKIEIDFEELHQTLTEINLLAYDEVTVYGIPRYKKGLSDNITKLIFNEYEIAEKIQENKKLENLIYVK